MDPRPPEETPRRRPDVKVEDAKDMDGLVFSPRSWQVPTNAASNRTPRIHKRRADGNPKRWFFQKTVVDAGFSSQLERAMALRQSLMNDSNAEDGQDTEDGDEDEMDDDLEHGSLA